MLPHLVIVGDTDLVLVKGCVVGIPDGDKVFVKLIVLVIDTVTLEHTVGVIVKLTDFEYVGEGVILKVNGYVVGMGDLESVTLPLLEYVPLTETDNVFEYVGVTEYVTDFV